MEITSLIKEYVNDRPLIMRILKYHYDYHMPPSEIDKRIDLPRGAAHDVIVEWWAYHKTHTRNTACDGYVRPEIRRKHEAEGQTEKEQNKLEELAEKLPGLKSIMKIPDVMIG